MSRFNPLLFFLKEQKESPKLLTKSESDWGIDDYDDYGTNTDHIYGNGGGNYTENGGNYQYYGDDVHLSHQNQLNQSYYHNLQQSKQLTSDLSEFIHANYGYSTTIPLEKFKFKLITSSLLDSGMILLKNSKSLDLLKQEMNAVDSYFGPDNIPRPVNKRNVSGEINGNGRYDNGFRRVSNDNGFSPRIQHDRTFSALGRVSNDNNSRNYPGVLNRRDSDRSSVTDDRSYNNYDNRFPSDNQVFNRTSGWNLNASLPKPSGRRNSTFSDNSSDRGGYRDYNSLNNANHHFMNTSQQNAHSPLNVSSGKRQFYDAPKKFTLSLKFNYNITSILRYINIIIHCIKYGCPVEIFKIVMIQLHKLITIHKLKTKLIMSQNSKYLNHFLLENYKINQSLITNLIHLKKVGIEKNSNSSRANDAKIIKDNLLHTLHFLNFHYTNSISQMFDSIDCEVFEQYININNIDLNSFKTKTHDSPIDEIVSQINKFHQLRRLFICQLLSISEKSSSKSFFVLQLIDSLNFASSNNANINSLTDKILHITGLFKNQVNHLSNFNENFEVFNQVINEEKTHDNDDILNISTTSEVSKTSNLIDLIEKLDSLSTNLKYFHKYNQSTKTITNIDEMNEKLMIFNQFNDDFNQSQELYKLSVNDLNQEIYLVEKNSRPNSTDESVKSPALSNKEFNMKSFHNASIKKRFSLPATSSMDESLLANPLLGKEREVGREKENTSPQGRKYTRLSGGLGVGLLTVVEEQSAPKRDKASKLDPSKPQVSYDDNYINILPPPTYETYNQSTFDQLSNNARSKKYSINLRNSNRFSMNSMNSTVSGVTELISTQLTNYEDDEDNDININTVDTKVSKEELRLKLEESFNRIYNLENENKSLKQHMSTELGTTPKIGLEPIDRLTATKIKDNEEKAKPLNEISNAMPQDRKSIRKMKSRSMMPNPEFLNKLEQTLSERPQDES